MWPFTRKKPVEFESGILPEPLPPPVVPAAALPPLVVDTSLVKASPAPKYDPNVNYRFTEFAGYNGLRGSVNGQTIDERGNKTDEDFEAELTAELCIPKTWVPLDQWGRMVHQERPRQTGLPFPMSAEARDAWLDCRRAARDLRDPNPCQPFGVPVRTPTIEQDATMRRVDLELRGFVTTRPEPDPTTIIHPFRR